MTATRRTPAAATARALIERSGRRLVRSSTMPRCRSTSGSTVAASRRRESRILRSRDIALLLVEQGGEAPATSMQVDSCRRLGTPEDGGDLADRPIVVIVED